jgi:hypothetical protein
MSDSHTHINKIAHLAKCAIFSAPLLWLCARSTPMHEARKNPTESVPAPDFGLRLASRLCYIFFGFLVC